MEIKERKDTVILGGEAQFTEREKLYNRLFLFLLFGNTISQIFGCRGYRVIRASLYG